MYTGLGPGGQNGNTGYSLLGVPERLVFAVTSEGRKEVGPNVDPAWQTFLDCWLKKNSR